MSEELSPLVVYSNENYAGSSIPSRAVDDGRGDGECTCVDRARPTGTRFS